MLSKNDYVVKYEELKILKSAVNLDADPIAGGLAFNSKLADLTSKRDRAGEMMLEAIWNKQEASQMFTDAEFTYNQKLETAMRVPETQALKSAEQRKAKAHEALSEDLILLKDTTLNLSFAESYYKAVYAVSEMLKAKNENLVQQIRVVGMMLNIDVDLRAQINKGR